jgi:hypothetical protein
MRSGGAYVEVNGPQRIKNTALTKETHTSYNVTQLRQMLMPGATAAKTLLSSYDLKFSQQWK